MIKLRIYDPRILAIDLRHNRSGFASFEGHRQLLGWGVRFYATGDEPESVMMGKRVKALLQLYNPSVIVIMNERWDRAIDDPRAGLLNDAILRLADAAQIEVRTLRQEQIRQSFALMNSHTRYEAASSLARIFPELASRLPPQKRAWETEHSIMPMFDAVALGLAYWSQESEIVFTPDPKIDVG
jgi:hypothetical protein